VYLIDDGVFIPKRIGIWDGRRIVGRHLL
jgi:hypothetical protein